jgi:hypothetical protein
MTRQTEHDPAVQVVCAVGKLAKLVNQLKSESPRLAFSAANEGQPFLITMGCWYYSAAALSGTAHPDAAGFRQGEKVDWTDVLLDHFNSAIDRSTIPTVPMVQLVPVTSVSSSVLQQKTDVCWSVLDVMLMIPDGCWNAEARMRC